MTRSLAAATLLTLLTPATAYIRSATAVSGDVVKGAGDLTKGGKVGLYTVLLQTLNPYLGDLKQLMECCGSAAPLAAQVAAQVNTNQFTGDIEKKIRKEFIGDGKCSDPGLGALMKEGDPTCSYFYSFADKNWKDYSYSAMCVPSDVCSVDVAGATKGLKVGYSLRSEFKLADWTLSFECTKLIQRQDPFVSPDGLSGSSKGQPYGEYLPRRFLQTPRLGTVNLHPSLLPRWRGASPVQRCLVAGDTETGITILYTVPKMDAGPIIVQKKMSLQGGPIFGKYKWLGAVLGCDGCLYGIPYNAPKILKISPFNEDVDLVDVPIKGPNMWQGGVRGNDGALYFIPRQAKQVLRVSSDGQSIAAVPGEELHGWNKFQGAVLARDGCIYGVPFIHRVGLALLKEARADLLGKGFDATIERLRCLCQRSQLSPEALVASAMEFKVTNRFLSDLEQAITSPSGAARLPSCFLERDLDRGRTQCRFLLNTDGGSEAPVLTGQDLTFWEASLPPPRVPSDPLTPGLSLEPPGDPKEKSKAKSQLKSFARKSQKVLSKVKTPVVLSMRSSGKSAKHEAPAQSLSDSERKDWMSEGFSGPREISSQIFISSFSSRLPAMRRSSSSKCLGRTNDTFSICKDNCKAVDAIPAIWTEAIPKWKDALTRGAEVMRKAGGRR
eukprot:g22912.t1